MSYGLELEVHGIPVIHDNIRTRGNIDNDYGYEIGSITKSVNQTRHAAVKLTIDHQPAANVKNHTSVDVYGIVNQSSLSKRSIIEIVTEPEYTSKYKDEISQLVSDIVRILVIGYLRAHIKWNKNLSVGQNFKPHLEHNNRISNPNMLKVNSLFYVLYNNDMFDVDGFIKGTKKLLNGEKYGIPQGLFDSCLDTSGQEYKGFKERLKLYHFNNTENTYFINATFTSSDISKHFMLQSNGSIPLAIITDYCIRPCIKRLTDNNPGYETWCSIADKVNFWVSNRTDNTLRIRKDGEDWIRRKNNKIRGFLFLLAYSMSNEVYGNHSATSTEKNKHAFLLKSNLLEVATKIFSPDDYKTILSFFNDNTDNTITTFFEVCVNKNININSKEHFESIKKLINVIRDIGKNDDTIERIKFTNQYNNISDIENAEKLYFGGKETIPIQNNEGNMGTRLYSRANTNKDKNDVLSIKTGKQFTDVVFEARLLNTDDSIIHNISELKDYLKNNIENWIRIQKFYEEYRKKHERCLRSDYGGGGLVGSLEDHYDI